MTCLTSRFRGLHCAFGVATGAVALGWAVTQAQEPAATTAPAPQPAAVAAPAVQPQAPVAGARGRALPLSMGEALVMAFEGNPALAVERLTPDIRRTYEATEQAVFDPVLAGSLSRSRGRAELSATPHDAITDQTNGAFAVREFLPTGTTVELGAAAQYSGAPAGGGDAQFATGPQLTVTQALLQGAGRDVNLIRLQQARLSTFASEHELAGFAEALAAEVETTYWELTLAARRIEIFTESLKIAEQQLQETRERIQVGKLAETEQAAAEAEVAGWREQLIRARGDLAKTRLQLLHLLSPSGPDMWSRQPVLKDRATVPGITLGAVETHVALALTNRHDLEEARLRLKSGELDIVSTRNGLLPKLDLFIQLGKTGYAGSFFRSAENIGREDYNLMAGLTFQWPLGNRDAQASHRRATLNQEQMQLALTNLERLVELDVRSAYVDIERAREVVTASAATSRLRQETLRAETEKFRVGRSTTLLVAGAQRDLASSQITEEEARVGLLEAFTSLYRLEGTLLSQRGIAVPGGR